MDKDKLFLDNIEEFDEDKLPDIDINEEELNRVKENIFSVIDKLKNKNKSLDFKISLEDALKIKNELGANSNRPIYYNKDAMLMRAIMIKTIKEKENLKDCDIISELCRPIDSCSWWWGAPVCYQLFITKDKLIIYSFDSQYKIINSFKTPFNEIKEAGQAGKNKKILFDDEEIIVLPETTIHLNPNYGGKKEDLFKFMEALRAQGVKDVDRSGVNWELIILWIVFILGLFTIIWQTLNAI